ncbi:hypothetical protein ASD50_15010 [Mesorhizobium sp. Root552]|uniref:phage tail length tape measure family protein n=1 Tax=Mesorhizobium sp. Root552 TaxID=1736555 RepID=UPI0006F5A155|nr:phage tail length tape measure family protein [Mesorhizobium sp. Root552]KQZ31577.1 hypothetical protein ASD50_15010 [Mesorhizobium sp. Root552]
MTVQLSSLRVSPEIDAAKYTAGAQQKVAADKAMAASSRDVAQAMAANDAKISTGGDVLARLSRQYVEGYTAQQRFATGLGQLSRGLETGKVSMESAERILVGMNQKLGLSADYAELAAKGQTQLATAVKAANLQIEGQAIAAERARVAQSRLAAANVNARPTNNFAALNATSQFQDIAITSAMGQSIPTIALQQGTQLGMAMQASVGEQGATGAVKMLGSAIMGLFSPINLISIGITAAAALTIQWFMKGRDGAKSLDETLKAHSSTLQLLKEQYGELGEASKRLGAFGGTAFTDASARNAQTLLQAQLRDQMGPLLDTLGGSGWMQSLFGKGGGVGALSSLSGDQKLFAAPIAALIESAKSGKTDLAAFNDEVERLFSELVGSSNNPALLRDTADAILTMGENAFSVSGKFAPFADAINKLKIDGAEGLVAFNAEIERIGQAKGLQKIADEAIIAGKEIASLAEKAKELESIVRRLEAGKRGPLIGSSAEDDRNRYLDDERLALRSGQRAFDADIGGLGARSPAERAAAARAREEARTVNGESYAVRQQRIELAGKRALLEAEHNLTEAQQDRIRAMDQSLASQQLELDLIGKTTGEQAALRYEFERTQQLKEEAARNGIAVDQKEIELIKQKAAEYGKFADEIARANLNRDLQFEYQQAFRSPLEQQIASRLRGTGLGMDSPEAGQMREIQRINDLRAGVKGFFDDFQAGLLRGDSFGKSLGNAILNALNKALDKIIESGVNALVNAIAGGQGGSSGGGLLSLLFGGGAASSFGTKSGFADMLGIGAANDNYDPGAITRSALPDIGSITSSIGGAYSVGNATSFIQQYASAIGIDPGVALRVARSEGLGAGIWQSNLFRNGVREPSFGPFQLLKGGSGTGFGAGLGNRFMEQTGLDPANPANWRQSTAFALDQAKANGWGAWYGAKNSGIGTWEGIDRSATKAVGALDKLSTGSTKAISGIANLGQAGNQATQGLSTFGSALNKFPAAPSGGGGGGIGGFFSSLFGGGGLNSAFSGTAAFSWLSANPGGYIGLFHEGGTAGNATRFRGGVDMNIFQHAPRYHNGGIANDEVPAILKRGEPVFKSMEHARQVVGGSNVNVVINNNAGVAVQAQERREADGSISIDVLVDRVVAEKLSRRGTAANSILRGEFGAQKVLKGR